MTLELVTEGCCQGHKCDNCRTCRRGRCCRKDNPDYQLPNLGEWDGPVYGELGVLNDDGEKVECHCCGGWFANLGSHVWLAHSTTGDEYRSMFGLAKGAALVGPAYRAHLKGRDHSNLRPGRIAEFITPEQLSFQSARPKRLQVRKEQAERCTGTDRGTLPLQGEKKYRNGRATSQYVGVVQWSHKWRAQMVHDRKHFHLGIFSSEEEAARAYDAKARELYGAAARLNFPDDQ